MRPAADETFSTAPPSRASMCGRQARVSTNADVRLNLKHHSHDGRSVSRNGMGGKPPALLTSRSMRPKSAIVRPASRSSSAGSVTSQRTASPRRPKTRARAAEVVLYDDDDLHWHFAVEGDDTRVVQLIRGKTLVGEIVVTPSDITYVQGVAGEAEDEYMFEFISETETDRIAAYHVVLSHGYDAEATPTPGRAVH